MTRSVIEEPRADLWPPKSRASAWERPGGAVRGHWPLVLSLILLWLTLSTALVVSLRQNQGRLVYDIDDPYIHMAIAKNLTQHGVWGVTRYEFSSSASSILWPLLIAAIYRVGGMNEAAPLVLNFLLATVLLGWVYALARWRHPRLPDAYVFAVLVGVIALTPIPAVAFGGMEHVLHLVITLVFAHLSARVLADAAGASSSSQARLLLVAGALLTLTRWEGVFSAFVVCVLFLLRRRWAYSVALGAAALLPVAVYGLISTAHGWAWFPNSILLNGNLPALASRGGVLDLFGRSLYREILASPHIELLTTLALGLYAVRFRRKGAWEHGQLLLAVFVGATLLHMQFAGRVRWFHRHDAYLVGWGLWALAASALEYVPARLPRIRLDRREWPRYLALGLLAFFLVLPVLKRGAVSFAHRTRSTLQVPRATTNIYEQQYQMALFLQRFYTGAGVAANDIGAINFLADIRCLDLVGLATREVGWLKRDDKWDAQHIDDLARAKGARIAIIYDSWFGYGRQIPSGWRRVGQWTIARHISVGGDTISFYAADPSEEGALIAHLREFAPRLPATVRQSGPYTEALAPAAS